MKAIAAVLPGRNSVQTRLVVQFVIFTLARRMGTIVKMIDRKYGHLVAGADEYERELLDRFDSGRSERDGRYLGGEEDADAA